MQHVDPKTGDLKQGSNDWFYADKIPNENTPVTIFNEEGNHKVRIWMQYAGRRFSDGIAIRPTS